MKALRKWKNNGKGLSLSKRSSPTVSVLKRNSKRLGHLRSMLKTRQQRSTITWHNRLLLFKLARHRASRLRRLSVQLKRKRLKMRRRVVGVRAIETDSTLVKREDNQVQVSPNSRSRQTHTVLSKCC